MSTQLKGIDVSKWQGAIDWSKVKADGIQFAIIRAGYGSTASQIDSKFEANYKDAVAAGIPVGVYWYTYATSETGAKTEAEACLEVLDGKALDLPVFYDIEYESSILALSTSVRNAMCKAFCKAIEAAGYKAGVYASKDFMANKLTASELTAYKTWIAQYASKCTYSGDYILWQYSSSGKVSGISGSVDMDYMYEDIDSSGSGASKSTGSTTKLTVDGKWGTNTCKRAQEVFNTTVDGYISSQSSSLKKYHAGVSCAKYVTSGKGSQLIKAIQKKVGATQDGLMGQATIKAMQKWLGTTQDGTISNPSQMVKAFQTWLNKQ